MIPPFLIDAIRAFLQAVRANPRTWRLVLMPPRGNSPEEVTPLPAA